MQKERVEAFIDRNDATLVATACSLERAVAAAQKHDALLVIPCSTHWRRSHRTLKQLRDAEVRFVCLDDVEINNHTIHILHAEAERKARQHGDLIKDHMVGVPCGGKRWNVAKHPKLKRTVRKASRAASAARRRRVETTYKPLIPIIRKKLGKGESYQAIADDLNDQGFHTTSGGKFTPQAVHRIYNHYGLT